MLHFLVLTVAGWVNHPQDDQIAYLREEHRGLLTWRLGLARRVSVFGRVGPPRCHVCHDRWPARTVGWTRLAAHRQAVSGPRRPARGRTACPYAVVRRTRRRGGAVRGVAGPAGWGRWHRLRLLRQIGDQLVPGVEQFLLVDDVVAVEDGAALVAGQEHGDAFGDVRADQVASGGAATIVEEAGRHAGRPRRMGMPS